MPRGEECAEELHPPIGAPWRFRENFPFLSSLTRAATGHEQDPGKFFGKDDGDRAVFTQRSGGKEVAGQRTAAPRGAADAETSSGHQAEFRSGSVRIFTGPLHAAIAGNSRIDGEARQGKQVGIAAMKIFADGPGRGVLKPAHIGFRGIVGHARTHLGGGPRLALAGIGLAAGFAVIGGGGNGGANVTADQAADPTDTMHIAGGKGIGDGCPAFRSAGKTAQSPRLGALKSASPLSSSSVSPRLL